MVITLNKRELLGFKIIDCDADEHNPLISAKIGEAQPPPEPPSMESEAPAPTVTPGTSTGGDILDFTSGTSSTTGSGSSFTNLAISNFINELKSKVQSRSYVNNYSFDTSSLEKNIWALGLLGTGKLHGNSTTNDIDYDSYGIAIGSDVYALNGIKLGVFTAFSNSDSTLKHVGNTNSDTDFYHFGLYGSNRLYDQVYLSGVVSIGWGDFETSRVSSTGIVTGDFDGMGYFGDFEIYCNKNLIKDNKLKLTPFARLELASVTNDSYNEKGLGALHVKEETLSKLHTVLGLKVQGEVSSNNVKLQPAVKLGWAHQFLDREPGVSSKSAYIPITGFVADNIKIARDSARINMSSTVVFKQYQEQSSLYLNYGADLTSNHKRHMFAAGVKCNWS